MIRPIVQIETSKLVNGAAPEGSILSKLCGAVDLFDTNLQQLIDDLTDTMFAHPIAIGLAAPQINIDAQVAVVNVAREQRDQTLVLINPQIQSISGKKDSKRESCMSIRGVAGDVVRRAKIHVSFQDASGKRSNSSFEGFVARAIQHEVDHLSGVLYSGHMVDPVGGFLTTDIFDYPDPLGPESAGEQ